MRSLIFTCQDFEGWSLLCETKYSAWHDLNSLVVIVFCLWYKKAIIKSSLIKVFCPSCFLLRAKIMNHSNRELKLTSRSPCSQHELRFWFGQISILLTITKYGRSQITFTSLYPSRLTPAQLRVFSVVSLKQTTKYLHARCHAADLPLLAHLLSCAARAWHEPGLRVLLHSWG